MHACIKNVSVQNTKNIYGVLMHRTHSTMEASCRTVCLWHIMSGVVVDVDVVVAFLVQFECVCVVR